MAHTVWAGKQVQEQKVDYLEHSPGSDMIKAFKKGGPAPHHLTLKMSNLSDEPITKETGISIYGNDIA